MFFAMFFMLSCGGGSDSKGKKQGELYGACYPNKTCNEGLVCDEENDVCLPGDDSDISDTAVTDGDTTEPEPADDTDTEKPEPADDDTDTDTSSDTTSDNDTDTDTSDTIPDQDTDTDTSDTAPDQDTDTGDTEPLEGTENRTISGSYQIGSEVSGIEAALYECGKTEKLASANTNAKGAFSFKADISSDKTYCVKANGFASCFKGLKDHTANISEITNAVFLLDQNCADLRNSETKIRKYAKLGTGEWLGELDYSKLSGIKEGLKLLSNYLKTTNSKTLSEKIAEDSKKETPEFAKFFNGFRVSVDKNEIIIGETSDSNANFNVEGGSTKVAPGFKITWTLKNKTAEAAEYKFSTQTPGEYTARAKLVYSGNSISDDSASVLFLQRKSGGTVYLNNKSENISFRIDDGIYGVIPKGTVVKKNGIRINSISYDILSAGGNQVSRLKFRPEGAVFEGDTMYFVHELGTVFGGDPKVLSASRTNADGTVDVLQSAAGDPIMMAAAGDPIMTTAAGDPIMQAAAGDPIMTSAAGDPIMTSAAGDPIMSAAAGDPIMTSAAGDPIMASAAGDPIMMGTSSSTMISQTNHYSTFTVEAASLPVSLDMLVARWCDMGSFLHLTSPIELIVKAVDQNKPDGEEKTDLLSYLDCEHFADLGNDLYELVNRPVGFQRNLNLIENIFFATEFYGRLLLKQENAGSSAYVAVRNGLELRSAIASLYTATTSYNRSAGVSELFDSSMVPLTYSGVTPEDYTAQAKAAIIGNSGASDKYIATKKEMMIFANYITTSSKGPDFSGVTTILTPDQLVCAWFNPEIQASNCSKVYTLNEAGHVTLGGTEVSVAEANAIFTKYFMPFNSRLGEEEKLNLFRTFYLALRYAGTMFYNGSDMTEFYNIMLHTIYLVFDGINRNANAVSIVDTFDASAHTVSVLDGNEMVTRPYLTKLSALTDKISLKVASESANVEKVLVSIEGYEFEKVQENTRTYYRPVVPVSLKEKSIVLTPGTLNNGETALKTLLGSEDVDSLGNITGKMTIVATSKIANKTYSTQKTYDFFVNDDSAGVNSKPVPANIQVYLNDSTGHAIAANANPAIILNPGNKVYYPVDGVVSITDLAPAAYTVDAFADGYYAKNVSVNVPEGATFSVEIRLDEELTSTADANLELSVKIDTAKHPSKVYIQIYNDDMDLVANETAKFDTGTNTYETLNIEIPSGRYTLLAVGEDMYNYLEAITLYDGDNTEEIKVVAKNACGNGIVDSAEECEPSVEGTALTVLCGTIYPASTYPEKEAACNPDTCTFNKSECGKAALCGDGILDEGEGCDGGSKACAEIAGFGNSRGTAPCKNDDCSGYITAGYCTRTTESCGTLPANAQWNDGEGTFAQTYDGADWAPAAKAAKYGLTLEECTYSCKKGSVWDSASSSCVLYPLSLALVCTGANGCFDTESDAECPAYGEALFGQDAQYAATGFCMEHTLAKEGSGENAVVRDAYTHYEWQASASDAMSWDSANEYCSRLNDNGSDHTAAQWRIPSPAELLTIIDSGTASPALGDIFTTPEYSFWAAEDAKNGDNAWKADENGALTSVSKAENAGVVCIRYQSNYTPSGRRFTDENETVKDSESGLMWQKQPVSSSTWKEALEYCFNVSSADKFDWRLPNRNELASLVNYEKTNGALSDFPAMAAKGFWTSTSDVSSAAKAWTVDFADGSIASADKADTKYVICVRNDEPCFGDECPDACGFNPCKEMPNSTGLCTANGYDFTCGCKSGFNWNHANCLLDTTRYIACDGLPENAVWNTVFGISQSYNGENWYPSNVGTFNKIPSTTECRFVCATNYKWDADEEKCLPVSRMTQCSEKKPYSDWNVVSKISQTWDGEKWEPSSESEYNEEASEEECRFICKEHYNWDAENNLCDPERQPAACIGLPANAHWWNESAAITQTWTNGGWAPSATGSHSTDAEENKCYFTCDTNYEWNDTSCVAKTQTASCVTTTDNSEWTGGYSSITQTWNGSEWFPSEVGTYNTDKNPAYCRFKCKENYNWNGANCEPATQIATCTGLPEHAAWNKVSSITQTFTNGSWSPSNVGTFGNETATECHFKCNDNYNYDNGTGKCLAGTQTATCIGLPSNAQWINSTVTQSWSDSLGWTPAATGHHKSVSTDGCSFECETDHYIWDSGTSTCIGRTITNQNCTGKPESAVWNTVSKISQTWSGSAWLPGLAATYNENPAADECRFKCPANYEWNGSDCIARTQIVSCGTLPANAAWNTVSQIKQTWNGSTWTPAVNLVHNDVSSETECRYTCKENYEWKNSACVAKKQTVACTGLPANAVWNSSTVVQEWNGTAWTPETTGIHTTGSATDKCYFKCIDEGTKFDWDTTTSACKGHTNSNVACDNSSLPANASWWNANINQTWNGTEWLPTTTGSFSNSAVNNQCRFKCNEHYSWNGTTCKAETKISACGALPANAQWNTASSIEQHWDASTSGFVPTLTPAYGTEATTAYCRYKCKENYEWKNSSCQAKTKTVACTGLPANAVWRTSSSGTGNSFSIKQTWSGEDWTPSTTGAHGSYLAGQCRFTCIDEGNKFKWENNACLPNTINDQACVGLPENAEWTGGFASISRTWNSAINNFEPSDIGTYNTEADSNYCRFQCKRNFTWSGEDEALADEGECVADTRVSECKARPANSLWNYVSEITQTWNGKEWLPKLEPEFSITPTETECRYICETGRYPMNGGCFEHPCDYSPCDDVLNSTKVCSETESMTQPYICGCKSGYYWYGKTGCRNKRVRLGNICTGSTGCFDDATVMVCASEGEAFHGQDVQYADKGFCAPKRFSIGGTSSQRITIDNNTGLQWQKASGGYSKTWDAAVTYCDELSYGGYSDWRLPTIKELMTIVDYGRTNPPLDTDYFDFSGTYYIWWSGTEYAFNDRYAWYFNGQGTINSRGTNVSVLKTNTSYKDTHCVRGTTLTESSFAQENDEVIKDTVSGLYWQKGYERYKNWQEALEYCENLEEGGYTDWRMPNINELLTIVDYSRTDEPIDTDYFDMPNVTYGRTFWSSTTAHFASDYAVTVYFRGGTNFSSGQVYSQTKTEKHNYYSHIRCVRSDQCGNGEFWDGKNCVTDPCSASSCSMAYSNGRCIPLTSSTYSCGCVDGYVWNKDSGSCENDPCLDNKCASMQGSDGTCTPADASNFTCGCIDGYFWDGLRCRNEKVFGNICTGQTKCYNATAEVSCPASPSGTGEEYNFFGQDAGYAVNDAKETCIPQSGYKVKTPDSADQKVVVDNSTGLMWQQTIPSATFTWYDAVNHCADLEYAGYSDWRLPKPKELLSILDLSRINPSINTTYFPSAGYSFWASKKYAQNASNAWSVDFNNATPANRFEISEVKYVRCVRGEPLPEKSSFSVKNINGTEVVEDSVTGLMWQESYKYGLSWQASLEYCETLEYAGFTDWRMPNINELISIVNYDKASPASDFPEYASNYFWSSTTNTKRGNAYAFGSTLHIGSVSSMDKSTTNVVYVRCVR